MSSYNYSTIDAAEVNGHIFVNNASIGIYPFFTKVRDNYSKYYNKWISHFLSIIKSLSLHKDRSIIVNIDGKMINEKTSFLMISNNLYSYKFPLILQRDNFQNGRLGIYYYKNGKLRISKLFRSLCNSQKNFEILQTEKSVLVSSSIEKRLLIALDGEPMSLETPLTFKSHPRSLKILGVTL